MTPGERGRGYGYDDQEEPYPPSPYPAYRGYQPYPPEPVGPADHGDRDGRRDGYPAWAYPDGYQEPAHDPGAYGYHGGWDGRAEYGEPRTDRAYQQPLDGYGAAYPGAYREAYHPYAAPVPAGDAAGPGGGRPPGWGEPPGPDRTSRSRPPAPAPAGSGTVDRPRQKRRRKLPLWQELPLLLMIAFCLAILIRSFLLQAFFIPSGSMEDTLIAGDRVLANKVVYNFRDPARGEVVVFQGTDAWAPVGTDDTDIGALAKIGRTLGDLVGISRPGEKDYIKRVIGVPGDVVSCCDEEGRVLVNGQSLDEDYVIRDSPLTDVPDGVGNCRSREFDEVVVEPGHMFVMGDHRQRSQDSRCQGQVPIDNVIGRAFVIVWPNDRWAGLSATDTFSEVPAPVAAGQPDRPYPTAPGGSGAGLALPLLLPVAARRATVAGFARGSSARSRRGRRGRGRRLAA